METLDETREAERHGELEAQIFDLRLREIESREREDRLTRLVGERPDLAATPAPPPPRGEAVQIEQLQRQVALLADYQRAILNSKGWQVLQMLRRPFGRSW